MKDKVYDKIEIEVLREPDNPAHSHNGGDYGFWIKRFYRDGVLLHERQETSADFGYCGCCGSFSSCFCRDNDPAWFVVDEAVWAQECAERK
jgi:hypothetical protein